MTQPRRTAGQLARDAIYAVLVITFAATMWIGGLLCDVRRWWGRRKR